MYKDLLRNYGRPRFRMRASPQIKQIKINFKLKDYAIPGL